MFEAVGYIVVCAVFFGLGYLYKYPELQALRQRIETLTDRDERGRFKK